MGLALMWIVARAVFAAGAVTYHRVMGASALPRHWLDICGGPITALIQGGQKMLYWLYDIPTLLAVRLFAALFVGVCWIGIILLSPRLVPWFTISLASTKSSATTYNISA
jgi:hypothetical protein